MTQSANDPATEAYTPQRIRGFASLVYRLAAGNILVREVGDFLVRCATAADEHGDLLQQRDALRSELARLHTATAEADAQRIRAEKLQADLSDAVKVVAAARAASARDKSRADSLERETHGNRLWFELAKLLLAEAQPLLPADKAALIEPIRAAAVAASERAKLAEAMALLQLARGWASLAAQNDRSKGHAALVARIDALLEPS